MTSMESGPGLTLGATAREYQLGTGLRATVLTTSEETDGRHDLIEGRQAPGEATALHLHTRYEERLWVVGGSMTVWAGEEVSQLRSGDFCRIPMNVPHAIKAGDEGCHALNVSSPAGFAALVERAGTPLDQFRLGSELDLDLFMAVTTELGDVVLGPPGTVPTDLPLGTRPAR